jgi:phenazine biosynthesis protein phzE
MQTDDPAAEGAPPVQPYAGQQVLVVDGEDTFTAMLAHLLRSSGLTVTVHRYDRPGLREAVLAHTGPVMLGPGPGDPTNRAEPRIGVMRGLAADLVAAGKPGLLGVCLGHELLMAELGLDLVRKREPHQGKQSTVDLFGQPETVGFYNSFAARCDDDTARELAAHGIEVARDRETGEVHAVRGPGFASWQFHAESVLTQDGVGVISRFLAHALRTAADTAS